MTPAPAQSHAFDSLADQYDSLFTNSVIGRAQRNAVWSLAQRVFGPGSRILELSCGSGEDALFLARGGMSVLACDISPRMIAVATARARAELPQAQVRFRVLANERLSDLPLEAPFTGAFSNFSGLNCVADLKQVARELALRLSPGAPAVLCFSNRTCLWEIAWHLFRLQPRKAFRRLGSGPCVATIGEQPIHVWYPNVRRIVQAFAPWFELRKRVAVGLLVPPSYLETWVQRWPRWIRLLERLDNSLRSWPILRDCGDHVLLHFRRTAL
jgi:ubiquinone/menaquinone biosynthesis C-methylase UbiE